MTRPVNEATQAAYYEQALALAFCQPTVGGVLLFLSRDERARPGWQSGIHYIDGTPKTSKPRVTGVARPHDRRLDHALPRRGAAGAHLVPPVRHPLGREARRLPRELPLRPRLPLLGAPRERRDALDEARTKGLRRGRRARASGPRNASSQGGDVPLHDPPDPSREPCAGNRAPGARASVCPSSGAPCARRGR